MRTQLATLTVLLIALAALPALAAEPGGQPRPAFKDKPTVTKVPDKTEISFSVAGPTDVEVAILDGGGKVVRHLAAGVIGGPNPPPPPLVGALSQKLTWDGKADWNQAAGQGPFTVRVRLGMGIKFGKVIADSPYNFNETFCRGLAVDPANGDLYVLSTKTRDSGLYFLRVYDRAGGYLREIMPYPATVDSKSREVFGQVMAPGMEAQAPMNYHSTWPTFYPVADNPEGTRQMAIKLMAVHPSKDRVVLLAESFASLYRIGKSDGSAVADNLKFAEPLWAGKKLAGSAGVGPVMGAMAPDGKSIYFAGYAAGFKKGEKPNANWPSGRIYKTTIATGPAGANEYSTDTFADVALPADARPPEHGWNIWGDSQPLHGVAVAKDGTVYVCDSAGGKVWAFTAAGKPAGSADVPFAYCIAVNDKAGALYVLTRDGRTYGRSPKSLIKLASLKANVASAPTLTFPDRGGVLDPFLAVDPTGANPQIWVSGCVREESLLRIEDQGDKLTVVEDLADRPAAKTAAGFACRMDVDREADLVYVHNGWAHILRYNGQTGEYAGPVDKSGRAKPLIGSEFCIRRDGMIYLSGYGGNEGSFSGPWRRLNRDLTEAPLPDGRKEFSDRYGKMGGGYFGNMGSCVTPDGHLYFNGMFTFRINAVFEVNPDGSAGRCPRLRDAFKSANSKVAPEVTRGGFSGALVGYLQDQSGGVQVDQQGNIYVGVRILPRDFKLPDELAAVAKKYRHWGESLGSVIKVRPSGGGEVADAPLKPGDNYVIDKAWKYEFTVPEKFEDGIKLGFGQRLDWYTDPRNIHFEGGLRAYPILAPYSNQCACQTPRFDVDDYGRLIIPNALTCSVQVVDNEGNFITRFGSFGNADSAGPGSKIASPAIPLAYPVSAKASFKHIYVADSANRRVVRVDPVYAAEEVCEVK